MGNHLSPFVGDLVWMADGWGLGTDTDSVLVVPVFLKRRFRPGV